MKTRFDIITDARKILELPESATSGQIKNSYRRLIKKWHPDSHPTDRKQAVNETRKIIRAFEIINQYCEAYAYSFARKEVEKYLSDRERWLRQFGADPIWAGDPDKNP